MTKFVFMDPSKPVPVWWPVKIFQPVDSKDTETPAREERTLNVQFVAMSAEDFGKVLVDEGQLAALKKVVVGWDLQADDETAVPFTRFAEIAGILYVGDGIMDGYRDFLGRGASKN